MLTLKVCKEILAKDAVDLTDEEIISIREWLSTAAEMLMESTEIQNQKSEKKNK
jgi:hypothetical protein